jgi:hypothetical protein
LSSAAVIPHGSTNNIREDLGVDRDHGAFGDLRYLWHRANLSPQQEGITIGDFQVAFWVFKNGFLTFQNGFFAFQYGFFSAI